jgi:hypothetical protein
MPPDPIEELFGPWGPGGPFGVPPEDPFGPTGQWTDELQKEWTKASQALSERGEALQKELDESWIMRLGQWIW